MSQFFIEYRGEGGTVEYFELSVTTDVNLSYMGNPTQHPVEDGTVITDQIQNRNVSLSFQGLITDVKNITIGPIIASTDDQNQQLITQSQRSVEDNLEGLVRIRNSRRLFSVYYDFRQPPVDNCVFTNLSFDRDPETGGAYRASMDFQQVQLSERARVVTQPEPQPSVENQVEGKTNSSSNSTDEATTEELRESILLRTSGSLESFIIGDSDGN